MGKPGRVQRERPERLFEAELQYRPGVPRVTSSGGSVGEYLGSGDGTLEGPKIRGTVRWDLFEEQGETLCRSALVGVIETDDKVRIPFESIGFFLRWDKSRPDRWVSSAAVRFEAKGEERYGWLNEGLAVWEGEFDMGTYRHRYRAYANTLE